ncbi:MAG: glycosyltransferase family 9 protein [Myxococcota bacterium]|nr:glycosyltransferase family 9 protein [Myxococcota bacterium]
MSTLIIRFSSLGDIVLTAAVTAAIGDVVYVTHRRYAALAKRLPGVREVIALEVGEGVGSLAARTPPVDRVVDLHGSLRSRALCARLGRPTRRLRRLALVRRSRVALKTPGRIQSVVERYCEAAEVDVPETPWISLPIAENSRTLGLVPLAAHKTKQWPLEYWSKLAEGWEGPVVAFGGPEEEPLLARLQQESSREVTLVSERGFDRTLEALGGVQVVVGGDTGLLHLAAVCGVPVVGISGPTTSRDGFWCHPGLVVEADLACRPCTRHGSEACPIGDHACMKGLSVEDVRVAVDRLVHLNAGSPSMDKHGSGLSVGEVGNKPAGARI